MKEEKVERDQEEEDKKWVNTIHYRFVGFDVTKSSNVQITQKKFIIKKNSNSEFIDTRVIVSSETFLRVHSMENSLSLYHNHFQRVVYTTEHHIDGVRLFQPGHFNIPNNSRVHRQVTEGLEVLNSMDPSHTSCV